MAVETAGSSGQPDSAAIANSTVTKHVFWRSIANLLYARGRNWQCPGLTVSALKIKACRGDAAIRIVAVVTRCCYADSRPHALSCTRRASGQALPIPGAPPDRALR